MPQNKQLKMKSQLSLFESHPAFQIHSIEKPPENETGLEAGKKTFAGHCRTLFIAFMRGDIINTLNSPVPEFRRRRQNLTDDNRVQISLHSIIGNRLKNWHMTKEDILYNQKFL